MCKVPPVWAYCCRLPKALLWEILDEKGQGCKGPQAIVNDVVFDASVRKEVAPQLEEVVKGYEVMTLTSIEDIGLGAAQAISLKPHVTSPQVEMDPENPNARHV